MTRLAPLTTDLVALARSLQGPALNGRCATWGLDNGLPVNMLKLTNNRVWRNKDTVLPEGVSAQQLAVALGRGRGRPERVIADPVADLMFLRARILELVDRGPGVECLFCAYTPCLATCFVPKLRRGEWGLA